MRVQSTYWTGLRAQQMLLSPSNVFTSSNTATGVAVIIMPFKFMHYSSDILANRNVKPVSFGIDPKKLDLKLSLETLDVNEMVNATNLAITQDECVNWRLPGDQKVQRNEVEKNVTLTKKHSNVEETANTEHESSNKEQCKDNGGSITSSSSYNNSDDSNTLETNDSREIESKKIFYARTREFRSINHQDAELEDLYARLTQIETHNVHVSEMSHKKDPMRTVRGIVNAGAVHDTRSTSAAYAQRAKEMEAEHDKERTGHNLRTQYGKTNRISRSSNSSNSNSNHYTLMDALRDCALNGNWSRSYHFFIEALDRACKAIIQPAISNSRGISVNKSDISVEEPSQRQSDTCQDKEDTSLLHVKSVLSLLSSSSSPSSKRKDNKWSKESEQRRESEMTAKCFRVLRGLNSTLTQEQRQKAWHFYASSLVGIMRWNSGHFYMLVKVLLECNRVKELQHAWHVMKEIGVVDHVFDERTVNSFISLIRRSHAALLNCTIIKANKNVSSPTPIVCVSESHSMAAHTIEETSTASLLTRHTLQSMNDIRREMVLCLEQLARRKHMKLIEINERTALTARIAAALRESEATHCQLHTTTANKKESQETSEMRQIDRENDLLEKLNRQINSNVENSSNTENDGSAVACLEGKLTVNDFNSLLRQAQSEKATDRLITLMKRLHIPLDASSYANIIYSLHSPSYKLNSSDDENNRQQFVSSSAFANCLEETSAEQMMQITLYDETSKSDNDNYGIDISGANVQTKEQYDAHKDNRITCARKWFDSCPAEMRNINMYNEMMYLLRAKRHVSEFNCLLTRIRGNTVRDDERWLHLQLTSESTLDNSSNSELLQEEVSEAEQIQKIKESIYGITTNNAAAVDDAELVEKKESDDVNESETAVTSSLPPILQPLEIIPAQWEIKPNGITYELLIQRARYLHDWNAMWQLFVEMKQWKVDATARLYLILLSEAEVHPPDTANNKKIDSSTLVLRLYEEMREKNMDTNSLSSTVSLVKAWSESVQRKHRKRW